MFNEIQLIPETLDTKFSVESFQRLVANYWDNDKNTIFVERDLTRMLQNLCDHASFGNQSIVLDYNDLPDYMQYESHMNNHNCEYNADQISTMHSRFELYIKRLRGLGFGVVKSRSGYINKFALEVSWHESKTS